MNEAKLRRLLQEPESEHLDYKQQHPPGLMNHTLQSNPKEYNKGKYTLLKDLVCLANSCCDRSERYLICGVEGTPQGGVVVGLKKDINDEHVQDWIKQTFEPPIRCQYHLLQLPEGLVGVWVIKPRTTLPHLPKIEQCSPMQMGQVWSRLGNTNTIAVGDFWQAHTIPVPPEMEVKLQWENGIRSPGFTMEQHYNAGIKQARKEAREALKLGMTALAEAVHDAGPMPTTEETVHTSPLERLADSIQRGNSPKPWYRVAYPQQRRQNILELARALKVSIDAAWLNPPDLKTQELTDSDSVWGSPAEHIQGHTRWLEALEALHTAQLKWDREVQRLNDWRQKLALQVYLKNHGPGPARDVMVVLTVDSTAKFELLHPTENQPILGIPRMVRRARTAEFFQVGRSPQELKAVIPELLPGEDIVLQHAKLQRSTLERCEVKCRLMSPDWPFPKAVVLFYN